MKEVTEQRGLSARQKTPKNRLLLYSAGLIVALTSITLACQNNRQADPETKNRSTALRDSLNKPKVNIQVNKHYDDNGNVVGFDSTYTSFYSNVEGDTLKMDSLMRSFDSHFDIGKTSFFNKGIDSLFFNDSLRYPDFFHNDFFLKRYELNDSYFRGMMRRMDSVKNNFYRQHSLGRKGGESTDL
jgi:hypothetical protein